jgi:hypothetical protein
VSGTREAVLDRSTITEHSRPSGVEINNTVGYVVIINCDENQRMFASCQISVKHIPMLIDTGSTKTLLAKKVDSLGMTNTECEPSDALLLAANSEKLNVYGKVNLPMSVGKKRSFKML